MLYKNKTTGGLIETGCAISGGDWEPVATSPAPKKGGSKPKGKPKGKGKGASEVGDALATDAGEDHWRSQGRTLGNAVETGEDAPAEL